MAADRPAANVPYLVKVIRDALEQHAIPRPGKPGCSICQGALAALTQLVPEESRVSDAAHVLNVPDLQDEIVTSLVYVFGEYDEEALGAVADAAQPQDGWLPLMIREYLNVWLESGERP